MNNNILKTVAISGASGFIGSHLCDYFKSKSYKVIAYSRKKEKFVANKHLSFVKFDITNIESFTLESEVDYFIHCAYIRNDKSNLNLKAVEKIKEECEEKSVKFIFLSSFSSNENALSDYGKSKFNIEQILNQENDLILRLGLVIGEGGLFKNLSSILKKNKIIPLIGSGKQHVQTVGIQQLSEIIETLLIKNKSGTYSIAEVNPLQMKAFYKEISKSINSKNIFIPIPYFISDIVFYLIGVLKIKTDIDKENYLGLKNLKKENINIENEIDIDVLDYKKSISKIKSAF